MQHYLFGSDKYVEIKMCDLEPFSKIRSHIIIHVHDLHGLPRTLSDVYVLSYSYVHTCMLINSLYFWHHAVLGYYIHQLLL